MKKDSSKKTAKSGLQASTTNAPPGQKERTFIDKILTDIGDLNKAKQIRPFDLRQLGYVLPMDAKIIIKGTGYEIRMVLDEDTRKEAGFCYLLATRPNTGIVLPYPYSRYVDAKGNKNQSQTEVLHG
jgi:hypothetical protein